MIITFCGHSNCSFSDEEKEKLKQLLIKEIRKNPTCKFYLGGYGDFDSLCLRTLRELKTYFPNIELLFITPYLDKNYSKLELAKYYYDDIIFPPIENVPRKFAILKRNEWMVDSADLVIAYVKYSCGGASKTLEHAKRKKVPIINISLKQQNFLHK
ncbi:MAG: hypothetical protein IJE43_01500 [Alphaproteobacteria bacterium]|nr:hypothetical protein [Alphaproteobacteria bacterium]